jgi:hypothetical protein
MHGLLESKKMALQSVNNGVVVQYFLPYIPKDYTIPCIVWVPTTHDH